MYLWCRSGRVGSAQWPRNTGRGQAPGTDRAPDTRVRRAIDRDPPGGSGTSVVALFPLRIHVTTERIVDFPRGKYGFLKVAVFPSEFVAFQETSQLVWCGERVFIIIIFQLLVFYISSFITFLLFTCCCCDVFLPILLFSIIGFPYFNLCYIPVF